MCLFFPVHVVLPSASGFWNGVFMPLKVLDLYFSNQRRCKACNFLSPPCCGFFLFLGCLVFFNTKFSPTDGFDLGDFFFGCCLVGFFFLIFSLIGLIVTSCD